MALRIAKLGIRGRGRGRTTGSGSAGSGCRRYAGASGFGDQRRRRPCARAEAGGRDRPDAVAPMRRRRACVSCAATVSASCLTSVPSSPISTASGSVAARVRVEAVSTRPSSATSRRPISADLARHVGIAARQVGELAADHGADAEPGRNGVVEDQRGQHGQRNDDRFRRREAEAEIDRRAGGAGDQHHADGDEDGSEAHVGPGRQQTAMIRPIRSISMRCAAAQAIRSMPVQCATSANRLAGAYGRGGTIA